MLHYALYARKSDEDKKLTEKSIADQVKEWRDRAQIDGLQIVRIIEESKSAMKPHQRPLFTEMLNQIRKGEINAILCWNINRLVRNMEEGGLIAQLLIDGVIKEIRTASAMYRSGDNILPLVLEAATSTQYSLDLRFVVTRGLNSHVARGGWNSRAYQGYRNSRDPDYPKIGVVVPDEQRFPLIRKGWEMMLTGAYTPGHVIKILNEVWGYRTRKTEKTGGTPLSRSCAYELFSNPFYAGYLLYKGQLVRGNHQPMVTEEEFNRVQSLIKRPEKQQAHTHHTFAFTGLMSCGYCGLQVTGEQHMVDGKPHISYRCSDSRYSCTKKGMAEKYVQAEIERCLASITIDPHLADIAHENIVRSLEVKADDGGRIYSQQHQALEEVERQLNNLVSMWLRGLMTDEARYKEMETTLQNERSKLVMAVAECQSEFEKMRANAIHCCNYIKYARAQFQVSDLARKREIAHALGIKYLFYGKEKKITVQLHPLLVEMVKFADEISLALSQEGRTTDFGAFELQERGSESIQSDTLRDPVLDGRTERTIFEVPSTLLELLRSTCFPIIQFRFSSSQIGKA